MITLRHSFFFLLSLLVTISVSAAGFDLALNAPAARPIVASDGRGFLAAWVERSSAGEYSVFARPFTRAIGPTDVAAIRLGSGAFSTTAAIAFGGGAYFVVWNDANDVLGAMVTPQGVATPTFVIASHASNPAVAWNGSEFFVVWAGTRPIPPGVLTSRIFGIPVTAAGVLHGMARQVSPEPLSTPDTPGDYQLFINPQIVWTGQQYVVVWRGDFVIINCVSTCMPPPPSFADMERLSADGTPLDSPPTELVSPRSAAIWGVHLATSGANVAVAVDVDNHVDLFLVQTDGTIARRTLFQWAYMKYYEPPSPSDIAFDGTSYVVAWRLRDGVRSWLDTARVPANGDDAVFARRAVSLADVGTLTDPTPSLTGGAAGDAAIVINEVSRVRVYFAGDLSDAPLPPLPPQDVVSSATLHPQLNWSGSDTAEGFFVERDVAGQPGYPLFIVRDGAMKTATLPDDYGTPLRLRAYNAGGLSAPSARAVVERPRRRATVHR
jgi:hypothetical protein